MPAGWNRVGVVWLFQLCSHSLMCNFCPAGDATMVAVMGAFLYAVIWAKRSLNFQRWELEMLQKAKGITSLGYSLTIHKISTAWTLWLVRAFIFKSDTRRLPGQMLLCPPVLHWLCICPVCLVLIVAFRMSCCESDQANVPAENHLFFERSGRCKVGDFAAKLISWSIACSMAWMPLPTQGGEQN